MFNDMPDDMLDDMVNDMPDDMLDDMVNDMPDDMPHHGWATSVATWSATRLTTCSSSRGPV
jgi:hypothetical protein